DLDIGSALGDADATQESPTGTHDENLALHDVSDSATGTTREMTQKISRDSTAIMSGFGADTMEAPTVEQPALSDNPTIRQKVEMAIRHGSGADQTAELAIHDLGLDLGALDTVDQPGLGSTPDAPTLVAGLDETSRRIMDEAAARRGGQDEDGPSATGSWHLSSDDLDPTMPPNVVRSLDQGATDGSSTAQLK